jgi:hypothetical protein
LSARLCASLQTHGERNLFLLETLQGYLRGRSPTPLRCEDVQGRPGNGPANLSETAGAEARAKA